MVANYGYLVDPNSPARRELEERWFGAFGDWLSRLNKVKSNTKADLGMSKSFQSVLYSASQSCSSDDGTTTFASSMSLTAQGSADYNVEYGFYLEGTIFPPGINQAYVYVSSHGSATVGLQLTGRASASYNSGKIPIIPPVYWPGLSYPGIVSIGPSLNIYGQLQGSLTLSGDIGATVTYPLPESYVFRSLCGCSHVVEETILALIIPSAFNVAPTFDVSLGGSLSVHAIPEASLVFDLLPNTIVHVNARAYISLDGSVTASFDADLSGVEASVVAGIDATAGVEASAGSKYTLGPFSLYHTSLTLYHVPSYLHDYIESGIFAGSSEYDSLHRNTSLDPYTSYTFHGHTLDRRSIISGTLTCPKTVDGDGSASCDQQLADDDVADADPDDTTDELFRRSSDIEGLLEPRTREYMEKRVKVINCPGPSLTPPTAHSVDYMNSNDIQKEFQRVARLVEQRWIDFFKLYNTVQGTNYDVSTAYHPWPRFVRLTHIYAANYGPNANSFFNDAVSVLSSQIAANQGSVVVGVPKDCSSTKGPFTQADLDILERSLPTGGITWTYP
ncbi:hypothetical protein K466DRAFT_482749 [Polyporus arcularius HHB13444]|uniref:Uncharacterized protein n=1 Tax=Polyporus arcularius HHB13444 TaxID=1314778 RepID=A0A5C3PPD9_9APHY|nr:hypothetical protein K466DRAFT_482749 [Polyporus arcularius HHB13444]